jgi:homoserine acetyltransferase
MQNASLPFYLYSGAKDVFVPIETFQEEIQKLGSRITYREFNASGHEGFYTEKQVWKDLQAH